MTSAVANNFTIPLSEAYFQATDLPPVEGATTNQTDAKTAKQLAVLLRSANLADWQSTQADIQLAAVSCIEAYRSLLLQKRTVPLLPLEHQSASTAPNTAGKLLTRHHSDILARRCNTVALETRKSNNSAEYQLYLACGFVVYVVNGVKRRMPILLMPVEIGKLRGRGSPYALRIQSNLEIRLNPKLSEICGSHIEPLVKAFHNTTDLRDYLRSIKQQVHKELGCNITANTGLISLPAGFLGGTSTEELVDLELSRTTPGKRFTPLPATPDNFEASLAIKILRFVNEEQLPLALQNFAGTTNKTVQPIPDAEPDLDDATLEKYYNCASWLVDLGLGHWQLKNITALPARVEQMLTDMQALLDDDGLQRHIRSEFQSVDLLYRLSANKDKIISSPPEMLHHASSQHTEAETRLLLQKAKIQASSIERELAEIHNTFHMDAVPDSKTLHNLISTIAKREKETQLTNPHYFRARRRLNEILKTHNGVITEADLARLTKLAKTLQFSESFNDDPYYKRVFGSLFKGIDTNWQRLDSVVNHTSSLSEDLGSALLVAQFSDHWTTFQRDFTAFAPKLESAASSAHKLCALIPMFINENTQWQHAVSSAEKFNQRVDLWQKFLRKHFADSELTPVQILSEFELGEHNCPQVTLSQLKIDERIYRHIVSAALTPAQITATSDWLSNVVERLQIDIPTIRRFLDKEAALASQLG